MQKRLQKKWHNTDWRIVRIVNPARVPWCDGKSFFQLSLYFLKINSKSVLDKNNNKRTEQNRTAWKLNIMQWIIFQGIYLKLWDRSISLGS